VRPVAAYIGRVKFFLTVVLWCLGTVPGLWAQVSVEVVLDQDQILPSESLMVGVRITNFSGQTLRFGTDNDWLRFSIEGKDGYFVPTAGAVPVLGEFGIESSTVATKRVDVAPYFTLTKPGRYLITAVVRLKQWEEELVTKPKGFDVIAGTELWEQDFGVPNPSGETKAPEVRKYALQQAIHLKQMKLYVRVSDRLESRIFGCFPLGPLVSFSNPEHQIDKQSNLHVLYQTGARSFNYSVVNPDAKLIVRQTHDYSDSRPVLRADREGRIFVAGGVRRFSRDDLPPRSEIPADDSSSAKP